MAAKDGQTLDMHFFLSLPLPSSSVTAPPFPSPLPLVCGPRGQKRVQQQPQQSGCAFVTPGGISSPCTDARPERPRRARHAAGRRGPQGWRTGPQARVSSGPWLARLLNFRGRGKAQCVLYCTQNCSLETCCDAKALVQHYDHICKWYIISKI